MGEKTDAGREGYVVARWNLKQLLWGIMNAFLSVACFILSCYSIFLVNNRYETFFIGICGFAFFAYRAAYQLGYWNDKNPVFVVDETGICDYSSLASLGHVPWDNIENISLGSSLFQKYLRVDVKNEEQLYHSLPKARRIVLKLIRGLGYQGFVIGISAVNGKVTEILKSSSRYLS